MDELPDYVIERERMVRDQLIRRGIVDTRVLEAMRSVPRHLFVPPEYRHLAYADGPLGIGERQTISQPYIVALMTQLLALKGEEKVLEVGTGSGYQAAVLGELARQVYTIERYPSLARRARQRLKKLGYANVCVVVGDGSVGLEEHQPYDGIIVTAAAPEVPHEMLRQLSEGGRLVVPVGDMHMQVLQRWVRKGERYNHDTLIPVAFVPLRGKAGWSERDWRR